MDSPASSRNKWTRGETFVCTKCQQAKPYHDFHSAGNNNQTRRAVCRACRNAESSARMRIKRAEPCFFCDKPAIYQKYCEDHWQKYREEHLDSQPDFVRLMMIVRYAARYFDIAPSLLLYSISRRQHFVHMRMVTMVVIRHLTNTSCDKLSMLFSKNISTVIRGLQKAESYYRMYEDFRKDVDGIIELLRENGQI